MYVTDRFPKQKVQTASASALFPLQVHSRVVSRLKDTVTNKGRRNKSRGSEGAETNAYLSSSWAVLSQPQKHW